jgi:hypothetical protein
MLCNKSKHCRAMHSIGLSAIYRQGTKILRILRSLRFAVLCVSRLVAGLRWHVDVKVTVGAEVCRFNTFEYCTHLSSGRTVGWKRRWRGGRQGILPPTG